MPDLKDWSQADVQTLSQILNLPVKMTGHGYVTDQSIKAGQEIKANQTLVIRLKQK
ncbi:MAG: PASTA domain-containing protein [Limosilactobacillus sp.]|nr:PASTA domain-containing protein [Limosilactobacillus sp.]